MEEYNFLSKKIKKLEKRLKKYIERQVQLSISAFIELLNKDGIAFTSEEFLCCNNIDQLTNLKLVKGEYHIPVINGCVQRNLAYIKIDKKIYNIIQPKYLEFWSDLDIINECGITNDVSEAIFEDIVVFPLWLN